MSDPEQPSESSPNQADQPYNLVDQRTKTIAELIALGDWDPSWPIPTGDLSTLPPALREFIRKSWQEQADNGQPPSVDTPPDAPQQP